MARIRTIKPEFFRDETLIDLEIAHPEKRPMLVFAALWGHCDKQGVFEWKPRQLALDILPFLWGDTSGTHLGQSLDCLEESGRIKRFEYGGRTYGVIPTFLEHQRITGKEGQGGAKYPSPHDLQDRGSTEYSSKETTGHTGDTPGTHPGSQEGKGREGNKRKPPIGPPLEEKRIRRKPSRPLPDDWGPIDSHKAKALKLNLDLREEVEAFRDYHLSKDNHYADWNLTFHTWLRKAREFGANRGKPTRVDKDGNPMGLDVPFGRLKDNQGIFL